VNSESATLSWKDPEIRARRVEALRKAHRSDVTRKRHSEATRKFLSDPVNLEKRKVSLREAWAKPENKKKLKELSKMGLQAAMAPAGRDNFYKANKDEGLRKKRSEIAKKNCHKRMKGKSKYSKLNDFFEQKMNAADLYPKREYPLGYYSVDFCFPENKLVVEADGDFWHANPEFLKERHITNLYSMQKKTMTLDKAKNTYLKNHGWTVLRFWERDIKNKTEKCLLEITENLNKDH
jgi:very-short-patch-repair endonuclease